jgi:hypothetical protein
LVPPPVGMRAGAAGIRMKLPGIAGGAVRRKERRCDVDSHVPKDSGRR